ncbi:m7GpppX diphosphatase [Cyphellophora attinorum]|uniref:M7GpppX diphosphatase n=1 Tax=Cyphellophora attinorum TaxID=1664694 RepID=A0A0N1H867_9EURO|nr:m7GpppX diphosphatase [Phialophora attinorum]KPI38033.1 m7GpppX diphosphatase [Phialophora attinorum]
MAPSTEPESKADAEALIPLFQLEKILNQGELQRHLFDQAGRRLTLLGTINSLPALLTLERSSFPTSPNSIPPLLSRLTSTTNLGANDIYRWYLSSLAPPVTSDTTTPTDHDLKLNLIHPCTPRHISKYTRQRLRHVTETPSIYAQHIRPYIAFQRQEGRLDWIFNILDGKTEQEDVILRSNWNSPSGDEGFLLLPDLNWDRKTIESLHLLALVQRRDIWSLRDLRKKHVPWLRNLRTEVVKGAASLRFPLGKTNDAVDKQEGQKSAAIDEDELKCYVHYHPTYYHFHVHVVHVMLEAEGGTQNVGKAWELGGLIATLEGMDGTGGEEQGLDSVDVSNVVGEESELWKGLWGPLKRGQEVTLNAGTK